MSARIFAVVLVFLWVSSARATTEREKLLEEVKPLIIRFQPLPKVAENPANPQTPAKVHLGKMLFMDPRFSKNHDLSCNSCHDLKTFGVDNQKTSLGHRKQVGERNSPSVYNAALHFKQFWDGRADDVESQALGPTLNPVEMAMPDENRVLDTINSIPEYRAAFQRAFPKDPAPVNYKNFGKAIGAFERTLLTPSRFDEFLSGNDNALADKELQGMLTFATVGCTTCHNGVVVGGNTFQKLGLMKPYKTNDLGRYKVTHSPADKFFFKPPSLRNVAMTAPYFHDGSQKTLPEAIKTMGKHQLGVTLSKAEVESIQAFLGSLTGKIPAEALAPISLPPSTPKTPKPDPA